MPIDRSDHIAAQPALRLSAISANHDAETWAHRADDRIFFMQNRACGDGSHVRPFSGPQCYLHVVLRGDILMISEIDAPEEPVVTIAGRKVFALPDRILFRLVDECALGSRRLNCRPSNGLAVLSFAGRRRRLSVTAALDGAKRCPDRIIDADEVSSR